MLDFAGEKCKDLKPLKQNVLIRKTGSLKGILIQLNNKQDILVDQNVTIIVNELKSHAGIATVRSFLWIWGYTKGIVTLRNQLVALVEISPSQCSHTLKHILLYCLFHSKCDHNLQNEHHARLEKT